MNHLPEYHLPPVSSMPDDFVYVSDIAPEIRFDMRYFTNNNFIGAPVDGYEKPVAILTRAAALALKKAGEICRAAGYAICLFDAYRPQTAVNHFIRWAQNPDTRTQAAYYPHFTKPALLEKGYIATRSSHSRGSTVDMTLVSLKTGKALDMGSSFDFFDPLSHHGAAGLTTMQIENRQILISLMKTCGFTTFPLEWWHYTLQDEPYPDHYFDFPVR